MKKQCHDCAPKAWRGVENRTGDYDFDATLDHRKNSDLAYRMALYLKRVGGGPKTGYNGYRNYTGDD